jgi:hypothetical protein
MSNAIYSQLPIAALSETRTAPGEQDALNDLSLAFEFGLIDDAFTAPLTERTEDGTRVTAVGREVLASRGLNGFHERTTREQGRVVRCPSWCVVDHPREQLAAPNVAVSHEAITIESDWGFIGIYGADVDEDGCSAPAVDGNFEGRRTVTPADLREAAEAFLRVADVLERVTAS